MQPLPPLMFAAVILWIIAVALFFLFGVLFLRQSVKYREEPRVKILAFIGLFLVLMGISRIFHPIIFTFSEDLTFFFISQGFFLAAVIMVVFYVERVVFPASHYIMTIIISIAEILFIINSTLFSIVIGIANTIACIFLLILYVRLVIQSSGDIRRDAIYIIIWLILFAGIFAVGVLEEFGLTLEQTAFIAAIFAFCSLPFMIKGFHLTF